MNDKDWGEGSKINLLLKARDAALSARDSAVLAARRSLDLVVFGVESAEGLSEKVAEFLKSQAKLESTNQELKEFMMMMKRNSAKE
jgi:hypothetical protein